MQILLEEWKKIVYKAERINALVWNFIYSLIYLFTHVPVVSAWTVPFYTLFYIKRSNYVVLALLLCFFKNTSHRIS